MLREGLQQLLVAEEFFQHLRWNFDEVAFGGKSRKARPLRVSAENRMHQMAKFVEVRDHVGVLHQSRICSHRRRGNCR